MGSKDGFVELGFTYELGGDRGRSVLCLPRCDVGTLRHDPGTFLSWWSMVCLGMFSAPAYDTFYILDGATYAELEQIETRSSFGGGYILGNVTFWFRTQLKT